MNGRDALDELRDGVRAYARGEREATEEVDDWYGGGREQVRTAIMDLTGHFPTESSHHNSEYLPFFRRTPGRDAVYIANRWDYLEQCRESTAAPSSGAGRRALPASPLAPSEEYAAQYRRLDASRARRASSTATCRTPG